MTADDPAGPFLEIADLLPEAMLLVSADGILLAANRCAAERLGVAASSLEGRLLPQLTANAPDDVERYLRDCCRGRDLLVGSLTLVTADGRRLACRAEGGLLRPRSAEGPAIAMLRLHPKEASIRQFLALNERVDQLAGEIARRQRTEGALREQREWLSVTLASIGDAVIATDTEGHVTLMNPVAQRLTGWREEEALGRPVAEVFDIVNEETRQPAENPVMKVLREGLVAGLANHTLLIARDGRELPIDDCAAPIRDRHGMVLGVVMIFHDIVERRSLERELSARAAELAEASRRKDEFLALLAHELRNPLAPIRNVLRILREPDASAPVRDRAMTALERQVHHLVRLVDDLLDVSRITRGKIQLRRERLDLAEVVERAVEAARPLAASSGLDLALELPAGPLPLSADPVRLDQVLSNLLGNAVKFTDAGGSVAVSVERRGDEAVVAVRDTGIGMDADVLAHAFEPFTQASRALDRSQGGLGIGLTLVRSLVEMHGGSVAAHSEGPGRGSELVVRLPLVVGAAREEEDDATASPSTVAGPEDRRRVLVVDDNEDSAETIATLIGIWGHEAHAVHHGPAALAEAPGLRPDVVLLDIGLPGMDGYEVARRIRADERLRDVLLVAMTGYGQEEDRRRALEAGFDHHLVKPVEAGVLQALLAAAPHRSAG